MTKHMQPQPPPLPSAAQPIWEGIITRFRGDLPEDSDPHVADALERDFRARDAFGRSKYGTPLTVENGRDALADALQEAADGVAYTFQECCRAESVGARGPTEEYVLFLVLVYRLRARLLERDGA